MRRSDPSPAVSVVIPTFQRREALRRLLRALERQSVPAETFEVVVAVDGSKDGTVEMLESLRPRHHLRWVPQPNAGRASACNAAIRCAAGPLLVILDDDMEPSSELLAAHRHAHSDGSRQCIMGAAPIRVDAAAPPHVRYVAAKFEAHLGRLARPGHQFCIRDFYSGNVSVRRDELMAVGLFDVRFRAYGNEDLELAYRLVENGVQLAFSAAAVACQHYEKSRQALCQNEYNKGRTAVLFAEMHPAAFQGTKLAALRSQRLRRRLARWTLSASTRLVRPLPKLMLGLAAAMESRASASLPAVYQFVLEYYFMLGAADELRDRYKAGRGSGRATGATTAVNPRRDLATPEP